MRLLRNIFALALSITFCLHAESYQNPQTFSEAIRCFDTYIDAAETTELKNALLEIQQAGLAVEDLANQKAITENQAEDLFQLIDHTTKELVTKPGISNKSHHTVNLCAALRRIIKCCTEVNEKLDRLTDALVSFIPINSVPFVITNPGHYRVVADLSFTNTPVPSSAFININPAITIAANNVSIDFDGHVLTIIPGDAQGIYAQNVRNISVKNGTIQCLTPSNDYSNRGIYCVNDTRVEVDNMIFTNTFIGVGYGDYDPTNQVLYTGVVDSRVTNCFFDQPCPATPNNIGPSPAHPVAIQCAGCRGLALDNNVFSQVGITTTSFGWGFLGITSVKNTRITNCQLLNINNCTAMGFEIRGASSLLQTDTSEGTIISDCSFYNSNQDITFNQPNGLAVEALVRNCVSANARASVYFTGGRGLVVENHVVMQNPGAPFASGAFQAVLLGLNATPSPNVAYDVIFKNCNFTVLNQLNSGATLNAQLVDGLLIEDCIFDSSGPGSLGNFPEANIAIGRVGLHSVNVKIKNCIVQGNTQYGIICTTTGATPNNHIIIEDCLIDGPQDAGIFLDNTLNAVVQRCDVRNVTGNVGRGSPGNGIELTATSSFNTINESVIALNQGTGILIDAGSKFNFITSNKVYNNSVNGIQDVGANTTNQIYNNQVCNNQQTDCVFPKLISNPGGPFSLGQNTCCTPIVP